MKWLCVISCVAFHFFNHIYLFNLCQIRNWQSLECLKSIPVLEYIVKGENQYLPAKNNAERSSLLSVSYINSNDECLILRYEGLCGLLMFKNDDSKLHYSKNASNNNFHPFPQHINDIKDVNISVAVKSNKSKNQQLISLTTGYVSWFSWCTVALAVNTHYQRYQILQALS